MVAQGRSSAPIASDVAVPSDSAGSPKPLQMPSSLSTEGVAMAKNLPIWLGGRDRAVAEALLQDGFTYQGCPFDPDDMFLPEPVGDWFISPVCQEWAIEVCHECGALFRKDYRGVEIEENFVNVPTDDDRDHDSEPLLSNAEWERIKALITIAQLAWDTCSNAGQLSLPGVA